jgi:hypothetical protein
VLGIYLGVAASRNYPPFREPPPTPTPTPTPRPMVDHCTLTLVGGESDDCVLDIKTPAVLSLKITPSNSRTQWKLSIDGIRQLGSGGCHYTENVVTSPESVPPFSFIASGQVEARCQLLGQANFPQHRIVFSNKTEVVSDLEVDVTVR